MSNYTFGKPYPAERSMEFRGREIVFPYNGNKYEIKIKITELLLRTWGRDKSVDINDVEAISKLALPFIIGFIKSKSKPPTLGFQYKQDDTLKDFDGFELNTDNIEKYNIKLDNVDRIEGYSIEL